MFQLNRPTNEELASLLKEQSQLSVSYKEVGLTLQEQFEISGYHVHSARTVLGSGAETFNRACSAMQAWKHFAVKDIFVYPIRPAIIEGTVVIVYAKHFFLWSTNACRIIYKISESNEEKSIFGYGYGTLPDHCEQGEERFLIEWNHSSNAVAYEVRAFSRANNSLVSLLWPLAIEIQDDFRVHSTKALQTSIQQSTLL